MASTDSISTIESRDMRDRDPGSLRIRSTYSEPSSFVVQLRQGAGVKEISWQLALVPLSADGVGRDPETLERAFLASSHVTASRAAVAHSSGVKYPASHHRSRRICDGHGDLLQLFK